MLNIANYLLQNHIIICKQLLSLEKVNIEDKWLWEFESMLETQM
jgi:hypothetical protein